jgi:hypothetical protein
VLIVRWRHSGDALSDEVVRALGLKAGQDGLQRILDHLELPDSEQSGCVKQFWAEVRRCGMGRANTPDRS